jgi:uncharacterized repeat protein (TIGR02543 family)
VHDFEKSVMEIMGTEEEILVLTEAQAWTIEGVPARVKVVESDGYGRVGKGYKFEIAVDEADAHLVKNPNGNILAKTFTVIYDRNGADIYAGPSFVRIVEPATTVGALPAVPSRTGYTFGGWNTALNGGGIEFNANMTLTEDITVYAQWIARGYTLSFNINGGDSRVPNAQTVFFGQLARPVLSPIDADQTFRGWNTSADGTGIQWEFGKMTMPAHDVVLYAQWTEPAIAPPPIIIPPAPPAIVTVINNITEVIEPEVEIIEPQETPTTFLPLPTPTVKTDTGSWALLNLMLTLLCLVLMIFAAISAITRRYDGMDVRRRRKTGFVATVALAAANVILFAGTQELFTGPMVWADEYSIASVLITLSASVATKVAFSKRKYDTEEVE